jgi:hypothetical protein
VSDLRDEDGSPDGGVVHPQVIADPPDHDQASVQALAQAHLYASVPVELFAVATDGLLDRQCGLDRSKGVILEGHGRSEQSHQPIPEELIDRPLVALDGLGHELERPIHDLVHDFRVQLLRKSGGVCDVAEEHCHLLALAFKRTPRGEDPLGEVLGGVGVRRDKTSRRGCRSHRLPAGETEGRTERKLGMALGAGEREPGPARHAEPSLRRVLLLAPGTPHAAALQQARPVGLRQP